MLDLRHWRVFHERLNSLFSSTDLDWYYSRHHQKLKFLICDLLFRPFVKNSTAQFNWILYEPTWKGYRFRIRSNFNITFLINSFCFLEEVNSYHSCHAE